MIRIVIVTAIAAWILCSSQGYALFSSYSQTIKTQRFPVDFYDWKGYKIRYTKSVMDDSNPPIILIHGFGASFEYYRKQIPVFSRAGYSVYAIDLLGFGGSEKVVGAGYSAELWAQQVLDFVTDVVLKSNKSKKMPILAGLYRHMSIVLSQ